MSLAPKTTTDDLSRSFDAMISLLEQERRALLKGEAQIVADIAQKKDELAAVIEQQKETLADTNLSEIPSLMTRARSVRQWSEHNHNLLTQMYEYYSGVTQMLRQTLGQGNTYGRNGKYAGSTPPAPVVKSHVL